MPFIRHLTLSLAGLPKAQLKAHPFNLPCIQDATKEEMLLSLDQDVTFLVGENGSGKSTLLESIALLCGFNLLGGDHNHSPHHVTGMGPGMESGRTDDNLGLADHMRLIWNRKTNLGFFLRAESFFHFIETYKADMTVSTWGGPLFRQSHGESFFSVFQNRFKQGVFLLDEPEAALSPSRQLAFLSVIHELCAKGQAQFIIATHSPIILAYPGARIYSLDEAAPTVVAYEDTEHYRFTKGFLEAPERYLRHLFGE